MVQRILDLPISNYLHLISGFDFVYDRRLLRKPSAPQSPIVYKFAFFFTIKNQTFLRDFSLARRMAQVSS